MNLPQRTHHLRENFEEKTDMRDDYALEPRSARQTWRR